MKDIVERNSVEISLKRAGLWSEEVEYAIRTTPYYYPRQKTAWWRWKDSEDCGFYCDNCGYNAYGLTAEIMSGKFKYCPRCGAKMEVLDDD